MRPQNFLLFLFFIASQATAQRQEMVFIPVTGGKLGGTLTLPAGVSRPPLVLIVPTSGPVDRDGNSEMMNNNSLRQLGDSLAAHGIATLRYDKRGVGTAKKLADERTLRFKDYATDVSAIMKWLKAQKRFRSVILAGQGEGALIGMMAAAASRPDAFIGIASPGERFDSLLLRQFVEQGLNPASLDTARSLIAELNTTGTIASIPPAPFYASMFRPSVQQFLRSWIRLDPRIEIRNLRCPVLLVQGDNDLQIDTSQIRQLAAALPSAKTVIIPGMNHIFRQVPRDKPANMTSYFDAEQGLDPDLVRIIVSFVGSR